MSSRTRPPGTLRFHSFQDGYFLHSYTISQFARYIRTILVEMLPNGVDWFTRNNLTWALKRSPKGSIVGTGARTTASIQIRTLNREGVTGSGFQAALYAHFSENPDYILVISGIEYKMVPWTTRAT